MIIMCVIGFLCLTVARRQVFSRNAPIQPVKPITNVTVPIIEKWSYKCGK